MLDRDTPDDLRDEDSCTMSEQEVSHAEEAEREIQVGEDRHEGDGPQAPRDTPAAKGRTKGRKVRRRRRVARAVELRIGKRRIGVDGWETSSGVLTYWVDGVHTLLPITRKIEIHGEPQPQVYSGEAVVEEPAGPRRLPEWMRRPTPEEEIAAIERAAAEFKARQRAELTASQRMVQGRPDSDD